MSTAKIDAVRLSGGERLEHITHLRVRNSHKSPTWTRQEVVDYIEHNAGAESWPSGQPLEVVNPSYGSKYVRTRGNATESDNLLSLPRF